MENLMNRIVAKPNFGEETASKQRIEKLMGVPAFQKMVDQADLLQDLSNTSSFLNQSQLLQKSMQTANQSFQRMLPNAS